MGTPSVLIVGAGPTGLTAAVELARRGIAPRIIDRDDGPTPLSKAVGISARSLEILEPSGITDRLLARGVKVRHGHVHFEKRELGVVDFSALPHRFNFLLSLPQSETETVMAEVLAVLGTRVEWKTALRDLRQPDGPVEVGLDGPSGPADARCDYVLGADGARSQMRAAIGVEFEGYTHQRTWSIADADIPNWPYEPEAAQLFLHRSGDIGFIIPVGVGRFRAVSNTADALACVPGNYRVSKVLHAGTFRIPVRQAAHYQDRRVYLAGDAAHVHSPVGARGMNLGIEDAASFARRLAERDLDGYTAERKPVGHRWIRASERLLSLAQSSKPAAIVLRNLALRILGHVPALQKPFLTRVAGLVE